jgi:hypothetical protein
MPSADTLSKGQSKRRNDGPKRRKVDKINSPANEKAPGIETPGGYRRSS